MEFEKDIKNSCIHWPTHYEKRLIKQTTIQTIHQFFHGINRNSSFPRMITNGHFHIIWIHSFLQFFHIIDIRLRITWTLWIHVQLLKLRSISNTPSFTPTVDVEDQKQTSAKQDKRNNQSIEGSLHKKSYYIHSW